MAKILEQSDNFLQQQETKNQQNEHKAKKMQETSSNLQKAAVPAFTSEPDSPKNTTENCDTETTVAVNATGRSGDSSDQTATDGKTTASRNCSIRK